MNLFKTLISALLLASNFAFSTEITIKAEVEGNIITTQDIKNHQEVIRALDEQTLISKEAALEDLIRQNIYVSYAKKANIEPKKESLDYAFSKISTKNLKSHLDVNLLKNYIKNELITLEVIERLIAPLVFVSQKEIEKEKDLIISKKIKDIDYKKLLLLLPNDKVEDLGWLQIKDLHPDFKKEVKNLKPGQTGKKINNETLKVIDEGNIYILSALFELSDKNDKKFMVKLLELEREDRIRLLSSKNNEKIVINYQGKKTEVQIISNQIEVDTSTDLYQKKLEKETKKFFKNIEGRMMIKRF